MRIRIRTVRRLMTMWREKKEYTKEQYTGWNNSITNYQSKMALSWCNFPCCFVISFFGSFPSLAETSDFGMHFIWMLLTHLFHSILLADILSASTREPTVRIKCLTGSMLITIKDAPTSPDDDLFSGMIYPKGLSKNSTCLTEYR